MKDLNKELPELIPVIFIPKNVIIKRSTRLEEDLGIYGEYADEFMFEYKNKFGVDFSNFRPEDYFSDDEDDIISQIYYKLFPSKKCTKKTKTLTMGDLEKGIIYGRLDGEIISMKRPDESH